MAARCASCSYPLSVSDSVSCCECLSYFHIDCAQLVGFPYYELSSDPIRNTFHCQTCKILPLPRQSNSFSDSESDGECTMPSRHSDYHLEGQPDFAKDMNEIKGTVQDLSELCKDMFREINELKSINLTLRCCVENLKHDGEQRDDVISDLRRRIEALEGKGIVGLFQPINTNNTYVSRINIEKEEYERYATPDPEYAMLKEIENVEEGYIQSEETQSENEMQNLFRNNLESEPIRKNYINERKTPHILDPSNSIIETPDTHDSESIQSDLEEKQISKNKENEVHFAGEESISVTDELNTGKGEVGSVKDWDWRGNEAIIVNEEKNVSSTEEEDEDEGEETSDVEDTDAQGWEILDEDEKSEVSKMHYEKDDSERTKTNTEELEGEAEEKRVSWADEVDNYDEENDTVKSEVATEEYIPKTDSENLTESYQTGIESRSSFEVEETEEEHSEDDSEEEEKTSLKDEENEKPKLERDIEIAVGDAEVEGKVESTEQSRLEGELRQEGDTAVEEGSAPEGEAGEGGQSPEGQGEVQPSELSEDSEPPLPPQPQHSPDDLWEYLKETVTGEHPATVEEFVQKLIGTLEHVPEEYLKPVIDYNIKRATSPSVTDGEHLDAKDGDHHLEGEGKTYSGEVYTQEDYEITSEDKDHTTFLTEGDGENSALHEDSTNIPEEPPESAEGYSAFEAAA